MRVTQNYSIQSLLRQIQSTRNRINTLQTNLATGKRINQISDDPYQIESVLRYRKMLKMNGQFETNIASAIDFMSVTSQALNDSADIVSRVKELAVQGANDLTPDQYDAHVTEINQLIRELTDLANTRFKDRYVFGGSNVKTAPYTLTSDLTAVNANPDGLSGKLKVELGEGNIDTYNVSGKSAFNGGTDVFQALIDLRDAFAAHDNAAIQSAIPNLDAARDQLLQVNSNLGAKINRYDLLQQQYDNKDVRLQEFLSRVQDTDVIKTVQELQLEQTGLQTSLQVLSRTMNISLVDFMR